MFLFNGVTRTITLDPNALTGAATTFHAAELYSAWKRWVVSGGGAGYPPAFRVSGGDAIGQGVNAGAYYFLMTADGWQIQPPPIQGFSLDIAGNLYADNPVDSIMTPLSGYTTVLTRQLSNTTETVALGDSGFTVQDRLDLQLARKMLTNRAEVSGDVCTIYDDDGQSILLRFSVTNNGALRSPL